MPARRVLLVFVLALAALVGVVRLFLRDEPTPTATTAAAAAERTDESNARGSSAALDVPQDATVERREQAVPTVGTLVPVDAHDHRVGVFGRVEDESGKPIENARVLVDRVTEDTRETARASAMRATDALGAFMIDTLEPGRWQLAAFANDFEPAELALGTIDSGQRLEDVVVRLVHTPHMRVLVTWPDGSPAAGCDVSLSYRQQRAVTLGNTGEVVERGPRGTHFAGVSTDEHGAAVVFVPTDAKWTVVATAQPLISAAAGAALTPELADLLRGRSMRWTGTERGASPLPAELHITLVARACVVGRVTDSHGVPIARARVEAQAEIADEWRPRMSMPTDASGVYLLDALDLGRVRVHASAGADLAASSVELEITDLLQRHDFTLLRAPALAGIVRDARGQPAGNVIVFLHWIGDAASKDELASALSRWSESRVRGGRLEDVVTDADGRFRFPHCPVGAVRITTNAREGLPSEPLDLFVAAEQDQLELDLRLRDGATIEGVALGRGGARLAKRIVHFFVDGDEEHLQSGLTDERGGFRLNDLEPGRWVLRMPLEELPEEESTEAASKRDPQLLTRTVELAEGARVRVVLAPE